MCGDGLLKVPLWVGTPGGGAGGNLACTVGNSGCGCPYDWGVGGSREGGGGRGLALSTSSFSFSFSLSLSLSVESSVNDKTVD